MTTQLRPYQERSVQTLVERKAFYLAAEQGLGKTLMSIEYARRIGATRVLVVCDATGRLVWSDEIAKWSPGTNVLIPGTPGQVKKLTETTGVVWVVVNYDKLSRGRDFLDALIEAGAYDLLVLDEAHRLKTESAKRTRAVFSLRQPCLANVCAEILPMSGTPAPNHVGELYVPIRHLAPHAIRKMDGNVMSQFEFEDRYCHIEMKHIGAGRPVRVIKGSRNVQDLKARLDNGILRLTKRECLPDLPPLQFVTVALAIGSEAADVLSLFSELDLKGKSDEEVLEIVRAGGEHIARDMQILGLAKAAAAVAYLRDFLDENQRKILVWANHHAVIDHVVEGLKAFGPVKIDGRDQQPARKASIERFLSDPSCRVFVGNIQAAGTGLTLLNETVQPTDEFFVESRTVPGDNLQAACRIHRIGQNSGVLARIFVAKDVPLDQRVQDIIARKTSELTELFA